MNATGWNPVTPSPSVKFENSPAESYLSTSTDMDSYPSLFESPHSTTMNPLDIIVSPQSGDVKSEPAAYTEVTTPAPTGSEEPEEQNESKKPTKKRKSWGQVLPEPKTNLPPRKRAKTEDEKEQRRVERVLRNRRAAQSSRERKRLEVEALEQKNKELEALLRQAQEDNLALAERLANIEGSGRVSPMRQSPVTFSQELFGSQDSHRPLDASSPPFTGLLSSANTVNPASLSPALSPVAEEDDEAFHANSQPTAEVACATASPDATQHPAVMLCQDLQCRSAEASPALPAQALLLQLQFTLAVISTILSLYSQYPLMQIAMSLRAGCSVLPTPSILTSIIWRVTTSIPLPSTRMSASLSRSKSTSTSTLFSTMNSLVADLLATCSRSIPSVSAAQPRQALPTSTLRLRSLRKLLTCTPTLARPLSDATVGLLRLVSATEERDAGRVSRHGVSAATAAADEMARKQDDSGVLAHWPTGAELPSKEVLMALLWAIKVEEGKMQARQVRARISGLRRQGIPGKRNNPRTTSINKNKNDQMSTSKFLRKRRRGV